jgi:hypothetical protein
MQVITDEKLIKRKKLIGQITTLAGLAVLAIGFVLSLKPENTSLAFGALIVGFICTQVAVYYGNRWGKSPRQDELVTKAVKGLDKTTNLYNYTTPVSHLLVGSMGIWILIPYFHEGTITYDEKKKRWRQKSSNWYMRIFGQGTMGRPDQDIITYKNQLTRFFKKNLPEDKQPEVKVVLLFTAKNVTVDADNAPVPTLALDKVKDLLRRQAKENPADPEIINAVKEILPKEIK